MTAKLWKFSLDLTAGTKKEADALKNKLISFLYVNHPKIKVNSSMIYGTRKYRKKP